MDMTATLRLLGHPALEREGASRVVSTRPKTLALLGLLVAGHNRPISREWLAQTLWPDDEPAQARANLRRHLHLLRQAIGKDTLLLARQTVRWNPKSALDVDVLLFERGAEEADERAVDLYRGEFCQGVLDESLQPHRLGYRIIYEGLLNALVSQALERERHADVVRLAKRALALDPLSENTVRALMRARESLGDRTGALNEYRALCARLRADLDTQPEHETTAVFEALLYAGDAARSPTNLPPEETSFVGREPDLERLGDTVRAHQVVSIVGTGGLGKTRLARRFAANHLARYAKGAFLVPVEPGDEPADLWRRIAAAIGFVHPGDPSERIVQELEAGNALLVFDACEHAAQAAREVLESLSEQTSAHLIATTRRRLTARHECVIELPPLDAPASADTAPDLLLQYSAYRLFVERATADSPALRASAHADIIVELIRKLDALPLAIELAAARTRVFPLHILLQRFGTSRVPAKLEETIASSYAVLSPEQQRAFCALSTFSGSFSLNAAEAVCAAPVEAAIAELVEASLLQTVREAEDIRYRMLDVIRSFASEHIGGDPDLRLRHARYYAQLTDAYQPHFRSAREIEYFRHADADAENFNSALRWTCKHDPALGIRLARSVMHYCVFRWNLAAITDLVERVRALPLDAVDSKARAAMLLTSGLIAKAQVAPDRAEADLREARELFRQHGNAIDEIEALFALSVVIFNQGRFEEVLPLFEQLISMQRTMGDELGATQTTLNMAAALMSLGDLERALELQRQALESFERLHFARGMGYAYRAMSLTFNRLERIDEAMKAARASVTVFETVDDCGWLADALALLSNQLSEVGRYREALPYVRRALHLLLVNAPPLQTRAVCQAAFETAAGLGHPESAALALGKAEELSRKHRLFNLQHYEDYLRHIREGVCRQLGEVQFRVLCAEGATMRLNSLSGAFDALEEGRSALLQR